MSELNFQREYWDRVAWDKEFTIQPDLDGLTQRLEPDARILDYGCGYGRVAAELARRGFTGVVGLDASPELIKRGLREHPGLDLRPLEGLPLPFAACSFDAALLIAVMTCIPGDQGQADMLGEIARILRPGGLLCLADFLINDDPRNRSRYDKYLVKYAAYGVFELEEGAVLRHHDLSYIHRLTASFQTISLRQAVTRTMNGHESRAFHYLGRKP